MTIRIGTDDQLDIELILGFHGQTVVRDDGYWWKVEAWQVQPSVHIPHGIRYSLTLHDHYGTRVLGFDNAHGITPPRRNKYSGRRVEYDHIHRSAKDRGIAYEFGSFAKLLEDFFSAIDVKIDQIEKGEP